ncbi:hypothetical protein Mal52_30250 [Symmachiella dynata]|uniref:Transposase IS66 C-terminal domain-containing protein n=1 Tax=Symmachiella dynata TaxID=2527995 RepID=A0A517ZPX7_9PLAN|nr:hypothetical protein Mal52_30250 [Symmachiella dynata]
MCGIGKDFNFRDKLRYFCKRLIASCKSNGVEPFAYLHDLFSKIPTLSLDEKTGTPRTKHLIPLLPDQWLKTHPQTKRTYAR